MKYCAITEDEKRIYNYGIKQAQWQITKAILALEDSIPHETKRLLKIIHDNIEKELK